MIKTNTLIVRFFLRSLIKTLYIIAISSLLTKTITASEQNKKEAFIDLKFPKVEFKSKYTQKCPICLEKIKTPKVICSKQSKHTICEGECYNRMKNSLYGKHCPLCRAPSIFNNEMIREDSSDDESETYETVVYRNFYLENHRRFRRENRYVSEVNSLRMSSSIETKCCVPASSTFINYACLLILNPCFHFNSTFICLCPPLCGACCLALN